jgi:hypothetical protein
VVVVEVEVVVRMCGMCVSTPASDFTVVTAFFRRRRSTKEVSSLPPCIWDVCSNPGEARKCIGGGVYWGNDFSVGLGETKNVRGSSGSKENGTGVCCRKKGSRVRGSGGVRKEEGGECKGGREGCGFEASSVQGSRLDGMGAWEHGKAWWVMGYGYGYGLWIWVGMAGLA